MSAGEFFAEHRKTIDARKAHLSRVGIPPPGAAPLRDAMPSQADVLATPPVNEAPLLDATHRPAIPKDAPKRYEAPKLPALPGVNTPLVEE